MLRRPARSLYAISSDGKPESHGTNPLMSELYGQISHESAGWLRLRSASASPSEETATCLQRNEGLEPSPETDPFKVRIAVSRFHY